MALGGLRGFPASISRWMSDGGESSGLTLARQGAQCGTSMLKVRHDHTPRTRLSAESSLAVTRRAFLARAATSALALTCGAPAVRAAETAAAGNERELIEAAIPARAFAPSRKPRRLLIFDRNVNYGGDGSIPTANLAFELMGRKTGAFDTVVSPNPEVLRPESLRQFD